MRIFKEFKELIDKVGYRYEEGMAGNPYIMIPITIANTVRLRIFFIFDEVEGGDKALISMKIFDVANISSPLKRDDLLRLLNDINAKYKFCRYVADNDGDVSIYYDCYADSIYALTSIVFVFSKTLEALEDEELKKFMKLQWT